MLPIPNNDTAAISAAHLAFGHAWRGAFSSDSAGRSISVALVPLFGISWSMPGIGAVQTHRINLLLGKIRNSVDPRTDYDRAADLFRMAFCAPTEFLLERGEWRTVEDRYRLDRRHPREALSAAVPQFISEGVSSPLDLAGLESAAAEQMMSLFDGRSDSRDYWRVGRLKLRLRRKTRCSWHRSILTWGYSNGPLWRVAWN